MYEARQESKEIGHRSVTDASVMTFGCLTGDYAQMHFDHDFGHATGMGGPIAHGLLSASWSLGALAQHAPSRLAIGDPAAFIAGYRIRFRRMVHIGDRFSLRWTDGEAPCVDGLGQHECLDTDFEILNQQTEVTCTGSLSVCAGDTGGAPQPCPDPPLPLDVDVDVEPWTGDGLAGPLFAEDLVAHGPRGISVGRTVSEADIIAYTGFTGELNPAYLNAEFARTGRFGQRIAPPMWTFCLAFGDYLRDLLAVAMPSTGFAGHLGDSWRFLAPVHVGDTLRTRHKPVSCTPSTSRPEMAIVEFALQVQNQRDEIVQDGRVAMMIAARRNA
jgi:acyl dehydratase